MTKGSESKLGNRPITYGEVMRPLVIAELHPVYQSLYVTNRNFREWVHLAESTMRAEKISSWTEWSAEEAAAYARGDTVGFSRLRGYTQPEIDNFLRFMELSRQLDVEQGHADFSVGAHLELHQLMSTEEFERIEDILREQSSAASRVAQRS